MASASAVLLSLRMSTKSQLTPLSLQQGQGPRLPVTLRVPAATLGVPMPLLWWLFLTALVPVPSCGLSWEPCLGI